MYIEKDNKDKKKDVILAYVLVAVLTVLAAVLTVLAVVYIFWTPTALT